MVTVFLKIGNIKTAYTEVDIGSDISVFLLQISKSNSLDFTPKIQQNKFHYHIFCGITPL